MAHTSVRLCIMLLMETIQFEYTADHCILKFSSLSLMNRSLSIPGLDPSERVSRSLALLTRNGLFLLLVCAKKVHWEPKSIAVLFCKGLHTYDILILQKQISMPELCTAHRYQIGDRRAARLQVAVAIPETCNFIFEYFD